MLQRLLKFVKSFYTYRSSIHFIYADEYRDYGSTVLRGKQLSQIAQKALPNTKIYYTSTDYNYVNCTLFITKWAIFSISLDEYIKLKENGNTLIFDPVDSIPKLERLQYADIVVAASKTIYESYLKTFPPSIKIALVDHNVDLRIKKLDWSMRLNELRVGYFGEHINARLTTAIEKQIDLVWVNTVQQNNNWLNELTK